MPDLLPIGRFAQLTGLSIKALHLYATNGLLQPAFVDPASGYRYYNITQLTAARQIRLLRSLDMPLDMIGAIVRAVTPIALEGLLHEHQQRIAARIASDQQTLLMLQQLIDRQEAYMAFTIRERELSAQPVVSIRIQVTPTDEQRLIPVLIDELQEYAARLGIACPHDPPIRISHEYSEELVDTEVAIPVTALVASEGRIQSRVLAGGRAAYGVHIGPHAELWALYWAILVWTQDRGYARTGPPREIYWMHPTDGQASTYRTEVLWPIDYSGGQ